MTEFANKSFSVYPGKDGGQSYRDNWDRIYAKKPEPIAGPERVACDICGILEEDAPCSCEEH